MAYVFDEMDDIYWAWERLHNLLDDHALIKCKKVKESFGGSKFITNGDKKGHKTKECTQKKT